MEYKYDLLPDEIKNLESDYKSAPNERRAEALTEKALDAALELKHSGKYIASDNLLFFINNYTRDFAAEYRTYYFNRIYAMSLMGVANEKLRMHDYEAAKADYLAAEKALSKADNDESGHPDLQSDLSAIWQETAHFFFAIGDFENAEYYCRKSKETDKKLLELEGMIKVGSSLSFNYNMLGEINSKKGDNFAAKKYFTFATEINKRVMTYDDSLTYRRALAQSYLSLGKKAERIFNYTKSLNYYGDMYIIADRIFSETKYQPDNHTLCVATFYQAIVRKKELVLASAQFRLNAMLKQNPDLTDIKSMLDCVNTALEDMHQLIEYYETHN